MIFSDRRPDSRPENPMENQKGQEDIHIAGRMDLLDLASLEISLELI